jgi:hypothetical protein
MGCWQADDARLIGNERAGSLAGCWKFVEAVNWLVDVCHDSWIA